MPTDITEDLRRIADKLDDDKRDVIWNTGPRYELEPAVEAMRGAADEIRRLRAERKSLHEACKSALADLLDTAGLDRRKCPYCVGKMSWTDEKPRQMIAIRHDPDCSIALIRAAIESLRLP
jgi:hypothetical protein